MGPLEIVIDFASDIQPAPAPNAFKTTMPLLQRFQEHLESAQILPVTSRILVGYSGGGDSTALLHLLHRAGYDVAAGHLHHGMRDEADQELILCEAFCNELGIPFLSGKADVNRIAEAFGIGVEEAGRNARYEFFEKARISLQCDQIATGHTLDDHVETILFHLVRGAGLAGLAGIPATRGNVIRPLLPFTREETRAYCEAHHLWTHDDPGNFDQKFTRVRIRERIAPELSIINAGYRTNIARFADLASEEDRFLNSMAASALEHAEEQLNGPLAFLTRDCEIALNRPQLAGLPAVLVRRATRLVAMALGAQPDNDQLATCLEILQSRDLGAVTFGGGKVVAEFESERIHLRELTPVAPYRFPLTVPGETFADEFGWMFTASPQELPPIIPDPIEAIFDREAVRQNLSFRSVQDGDRITPVGRSGEKKVGDLFTESKLTLAARRRLPILCDMVGPIWIPGIAVAQRAAATSTTESKLWVRLSPMTFAAS